MHDAQHARASLYDGLASDCIDVYIAVSGPLRYAFVDGMNVRDSRVANSVAMECRA